MSWEEFRLPGQLDARLLQLRPQRLAEGLELLLRFPDLAHPDVLVVAEGDMELAPVGRPAAGVGQGAPNRFVLVLGHVGGWKTDEDAHGGPPWVRTGRQTISR